MYFISNKIKCLLLGLSVLPLSLISHWIKYNDYNNKYDTFTSASHKFLIYDCSFVAFCFVVFRGVFFLVVCQSQWRQPRWTEQPHIAFKLSVFTRIFVSTIFSVSFFFISPNFPNSSITMCGRERTTRGMGSGAGGNTLAFKIYCKCLLSFKQTKVTGAAADPMGNCISFERERAFRNSWTNWQVNIFCEFLFHFAIK